MKIFPYRDYAHYLAAQNEANVRKIDTVWVSRQTVREIVRYHGEARSVLCHGTRNGAEQELFLEAYPKAHVLGTEIAETAWRFPMTVQWDMQEVRADWVGCFDIVYSNSIDHAIKPEQTMKTWLGQLSRDGRLYIDHANGAQNRATESDPLEINDEEMECLIRQSGGEICALMKGLGRERAPTRIYAVKLA